MGINNPRAKIRRLFARDGNRCFWCGCALVQREDYCRQPHFSIATIEHLIPRSFFQNEKDSHEFKNLRLSCYSCNVVRQTGWTDTEVQTMVTCPLLHVLKSNTDLPIWIPKKHKPKVPVDHLLCVPPRTRKAGASS